MPSKPHQNRTSITALERKRSWRAASVSDDAAGRNVSDWRRITLARGTRMPQVQRSEYPENIQSGFSVIRFAM